MGRPPQLIRGRVTTENIAVKEIAGISSAISRKST